MSPGVQTAIAAALVLLAALYVGRRVWGTVAKGRRRRNDAGCGDGCGCGGSRAE